MSAKDDILSILEQNREIPISGEALANRIGISRAAIWKAIHKLKEEGYQITATTNKGYCLTCNNDVISSQGIRPFLAPSNKEIPIFTYKTIDSTNHFAKKLSLDQAVHGTTVISEEQTAGRGRRGRVFYSPDGLGIYMSMILKLDMNVQDAILITTAASVAVSNAIERVTKTKTSIKWVNDLYKDNKKICGILTEAVNDFETGMIESIILGIGINFVQNEQGFPEDLQQVAGALYQNRPKGITRNQLCGAIINEILTTCNELPQRNFLTTYRERSMVLGKDIYVITHGDKKTAHAIDIDNNGGLVVQFSNGKKTVLNTGEISIRLQPEQS